MARRTPLLIVLAWLLSLGLFAAEPAVEFAGVAMMPGRTILLLKDAATGTSQWVQTGQTVAGYKLMSFDPQTETVAVTQNGETFRLPLKVAKVNASDPEALRTMLAPIAARIVPAGVGVVAGQKKLLFGRRNIAVGAMFTVAFNREDYQFELADIGDDSFTLRYQGVEFVQSLKGKDAGRAAVGAPSPSR